MGNFNNKVGVGQIAEDLEKIGLGNRSEGTK